MDTSIVVVSSISIFFTVLYKVKNSGSNNFDLNALLVYCFIFGPIANMLGAFCINSDDMMWSITSSVLFLVSILLLYFSNNRFTNFAMFLAFCAAATSFGITIVQDYSSLLKTSQILSYISLYFVLVFSQD